MAFTSLAHLLDIDWLKEAYRRTRKDGAVGVDGVTAEHLKVRYQSMPVGQPNCWFKATRIAQRR
jgi:hypothetical protein